MNDAEFERYLAECSEELKLKNAALEATYGLSNMAKWTLDDHSHVLSFLDENGHAKVKFAITPIGTYSVRQENWKWGWANRKLHTAFREKADSLKDLQAITDFDFFGDDEAFAADEVMAWEMAAAAVNHLSSQGCYRTPHKDIWLFLAIDGPLN